MYVVNKGHFSSWMTLTAYYSTLAIIIIFNTMINHNKNYKSAKTWIGILFINSFQNLPLSFTEKLINLFLFRNNLKFVEFGAVIQQFRLCAHFWEKEGIHK